MVVPQSALEKAQALKARKSDSRALLISAITAYDYPTARLVDEAGIDLILVGDSLGMVVLGFPDTTHVTIDHMIHHVEAVARGAKRALIVGDLPINSYQTPEQAVQTARKLVAAGADAVKLEGGISHREQIAAILSEGIPMLGHLGMLPQSVQQEGGYKKKGKTAEGAQRLIDDVECLNDLGCFSIVLESVVSEVAQKVTQHSKVPTIGIGCGTATCDGEVAVVTDVVGSYPWFVPPFARPKANVADEITRATNEYIQEVQKSS